MPGDTRRAYRPRTLRECDKYAWNFNRKTSTESGHLRKLGVDGRIILKLI
jgi:hypothetical protein